MRDLLYAGRILRRDPLFTATAVCTIALGIGATTAIFSVTAGVLLQPLPYKDQDRLVLACRDDTRRNVRDFPLSTPDFFDLRSGTKALFESMAAIDFITGRWVIPGRDGTPEQVTVASVTPGFLPLLGAKIAFGREFENTDGEPQSQPGIAILSYEYWQRRYGGDVSIVGRSILGGRVMVAGVLTPGFELLLPPGVSIERAPDVWYASRLSYDNSQRMTSHLRVIGKLRPGVSLKQAQAGTDAAASQLRRAFAVKEASGFAIRLEPMRAHLVTDVRPAILALMGAVILLLLIACANVANLLLVRASQRECELVVRAALGGSPWRLARQILAEALLLSGLGTLLGVWLAWVGISELLVIAPANLPRLDSVRIDLSVLVFAAITGLAVAAIFGLAPALRAAKPDVMHVLRASGRNAALGGGALFRDGVVIAEVALSFVLLVAAGLLVRSFVELQRLDPGYDPHSMLTFQLNGSSGVAVPQQRAAFLREIRARLSTLPGVQAVTGANVLPLNGAFYSIRWSTEQMGGDPTHLQTSADYQLVLPGYFETLRTRLIEGRTFTEDDNSPERKVVVIDEMLAAKAFPSERAAGKRLGITSWGGAGTTWLEVIGVVAHQRHTSLSEQGREQLYLANGYLGHGMVEWAVRTVGDPMNHAAAVRAGITKMGQDLVVTGMQPMDALVAKAQAGTRFSLLLIGVFAVIAAVLAGVGLYGVLSTVVRQRTAEIGVRMALGAHPAAICQLLMGKGLRLSVAGVTIGLVAAPGLTRVMASMLAGVKSTDPAIFGTMAALFLMIAMLASWLPARRAARLGPGAALREQ